MSSPPKISIVIVQFNNSKDTLECLNSVKELNYPNFEVIVVDNASILDHFDTTRNWIESQDNPKFTFVKSNVNFGYSGGNNIGIKKALANGANYVFVLNNDTVIPKDLLSKLVEIGENNEKIGILMPVILEEEKKTFWGKIYWLSSELEHYKKKLITKGPVKLAGKKYIPGTAMLIKNKVFNKARLFDERYFLYFEDADYSMKAKKARYDLYLVPDVVIKHNVSASTMKLGSSLLLRYHMRNSILFNVRHAPVLYKIFIPIWIFLVSLKQLIKIVFIPSKREQSIAILNGIWDFYNNRWGKIKN